MNAKYYVSWYEGDMVHMSCIPFAEVPTTLERKRVIDPHAHLYAIDGSGAQVDLTYRYPVREVASV